jgi:hypothetical protein
MKIVSITPAGRADVFNMEVEGTHDYVVNGGLVAHNCSDATRYFLMDHPMSATKKPQKEYRPYDPFDRGDDE